MRIQRTKALKSEFLVGLRKDFSEGQADAAHPGWGIATEFGDTGPEAEMQIIRDWSAVSALAAHGQVGLGEDLRAGPVGYAIG